MNEWHLDQTLAARYAAGQLTAAVAASVEAHVTRCRKCQSDLAQLVPQHRLAAIWAEVADSVDAPRPRRVERLMVKLGLSQGDARLVASAPALQRAWLLALCATLLFTVTASSLRPQDAQLFLLVAPILPVVGVGLAYGPWTDPVYEVAVAAPYSAVRLLLLRSGMVLIVTIALTAAAGALIPAGGFMFAWLLPCAALVAATLALAAWMPPSVAAACTTAGWLALGCALWVRDSFVTTAFGPSAQVAAVAVVTLAVTVALIARAQAIGTWRTR